MQPSMNRVPHDFEEGMCLSGYGVSPLTLNCILMEIKAHYLDAFIFNIRV